MKVSILMATYNRPKELARALKSIKNQSYEDYEVILVNDNGSDITDIATNSKIKDLVLWINSGNIGPTKSFQIALENATGDLIVQLDDDDEFEKHGIELMVKPFEGSNVDAVFARSIRIKPNGECGPYPPYNFNIDDPLKKNWCVSCARMVKVSVLKKIGFDPSLKVRVDWDINIQLYKNYESYFIDKVVSIVHLSNESWFTSHPEFARKDYAIMKEKYE